MLKAFFSSGPRLVHHSPRILVMFLFSRLGYFSLTMDLCSEKIRRKFFILKRKIYKLRIMFKEERASERESERKRNRGIERQRDREIERKRDREKEKQRDRETEG